MLLLTVETSAKTRVNLEEAYFTVVRMIRSTSARTFYCRKADTVTDQREGVEKPKKSKKRKCTIL